MEGLSIVLTERFDCVKICKLKQEPTNHIL
jgi:hypothetical protein